MSNPPILVRTQGGKDLVVVAPKDGHVYGIDRATGERLYRVPATQIANVEAPFVVGEPVRFCPGSVGGAEWNSPAYDPATNLILVGEVDWCFAVTLEDTQKLETAPMGVPWSGMAALNPFNDFGHPLEGDEDWHGWVYAIDADTGQWAWRAQLNYPVLSGMTPTAGGVVFFGDVDGNFYALNAATGEKLWGEHLGGGIGGGVITYTAGRHAEGRGGRRLHLADVADEDRHRQGGRPRARRRRDGPVRPTDPARTRGRPAMRQDEDWGLRMELDPVILSRIQFAFVISFHIIFPAFTIGLAAWLATIEGMRLFTGNPLYRRVFDFWLKVFALSFGMGVVTGIVMAFQFGTNWGVLAERTGSIQGPLLGYEAFTAFMLEASFFGVMLLGRDRVSPRLLLLRLLHGVARNDVLLVLDPRQQFLDAGPGRPRDRRRQDHSRPTGARSCSGR